jgi:hypothetical protein
MPKPVQADAAYTSFFLPGGKSDRGRMRMSAKGLPQVYPLVPRPTARRAAQA